MKIMAFIRAHRSYGHLAADLDPLQLDIKYPQLNIPEKYRSNRKESMNLLDYKAYGFEEKDLDKSYYIDLPQEGGILARQKNWTLRELN